MGHEGVAQMALSMLDMALHDALAREAGVPLYKLLGGSNAPLPTYHSCGLGIAEPQDVAREAKEMVAEHGGFTHMKLRMGRERCRRRGRGLQGRAQRHRAGRADLVRLQPGTAFGASRWRRAAPSTAWA